MTVLVIILFFLAIASAVSIRSERKAAKSKRASEVHRKSTHTILKSPAISVENLSRTGISPKDSGFDTLLPNLAKDGKKVPEQVLRETDEPVSIGDFSSSADHYAIRVPVRARLLDARWVGPNSSLIVAGLELKGGMFYTGTWMPGKHGECDPCLVNPNLAVSNLEGLASTLGYWPSFSRLDAICRRKYLDWIAGGRSDRTIDIGYVFLYFYGLERRVLTDAKHDEDARKNLPTIAEELHRLLALYAESSFSFQRYATGLLDVIQAMTATDRSYERPLQRLPETYEVPFAIKLALGQASKDGAPLSADLILVWVKHDPQIYLRTAATRCPNEFELLLRERYAQKHGTGLILPKNRTKLRCTYHPASSALSGQGDIEVANLDVPDVTVVPATIAEIQDLVNSVTNELDGYSRLIGRKPDAIGTGEAWLMLPFTLWPDPIKARMSSLSDSLSSKPLLMRYSDLLDRLGIKLEVSRKQALAIVELLQTQGVAVEPDIENGARTPKSGDYLVLFQSLPDQRTASISEHYRTAQMAVQLSAIVAFADGEFSSSEQQIIEDNINRWEGLNDSDRVRLRAHVQLLAQAPITLSGLKKKLLELPISSREVLAAHMTAFAHADGVISPDEIKVLEKAYKIMGIEANRVYSDLHAPKVDVAINSEQVSGGVKLDLGKIRALQKETQEVSNLLQGIFVEEAPIVVNDVAVQEDELPDSLILGLDPEHAKLAHLLLSRSHWCRADLEDAASDLGLMLDGALERINDAAFDHFNMALLEGEEPIEINQTIIDFIIHEPSHQTT